MARRNTNFYYAFVVLPPRKRRAIIAAWDFFRAVDDAVDEKAESGAVAKANGAAAAEVAKWRRELAACYDGGTPETPQGQRLLPHITAFRLPRAGFEAVIDGVEMDLVKHRYASFDELYQYCLRVASAVGLVCIEIFGYRNAGCRQYASDLGVALQLTNIIRDLGRDFAVGRLYLPQEDLARFGCREEDLARGVVTDPIRRLLAFESARARDYYRRASEALPREDAKSQVAGRIMGAIYFDLLCRIERSGFNVFSGTIRASRPRRAWIAGTTWLGTMAGLT